VSGDARFDALRAQRWFHSIDLPDGTATPGIFDNRASVRRIDWPGLEGRRCLDVGTCDGFWAFEMERRGAAEVVAIDVDSRSKPRFDLAAEALGSRARRLSCSVQDLDCALHGLFDVVFCGTVLIHLREPERALKRMREVCRGELVLVECVDARLDLLRGAPAARLEPAPVERWHFNTAGLQSMVRGSGFDIVSTSRPFLTPNGTGLYLGQDPRGPMSRLKRWTRTRLAASSSPLVTAGLGLALGAYDVAIRAQPRPKVISARG